MPLPSKPVAAVRKMTKMESSTLRGSNCTGSADVRMIHDGGRLVCRAHALAWGAPIFCFSFFFFFPSPFLR